MGIYKNNVPWSSKFSFQELSLEQQQLRRVELLLLNNSAGLFISHIKSNLNLPIDVIQKRLDELRARNVDGFWVHPHFALNVPYRGNFPVAPKQAEIVTCALKVIDLIRNMPNITITALLYKSKIQNPNDLILLLQNQMRVDVDLDTQYLIGNYLYRRFNIYRQVVC